MTHITDSTQQIWHLEHIILVWSSVGWIAQYNHSGQRDSGCISTRTGSRVFNLCMTAVWTFRVCLDDKEEKYSQEKIRFIPYSNQSPLCKSSLLRHLVQTKHEEKILTEPTTYAGQDERKVSRYEQWWMEVMEEYILAREVDAQSSISLHNTL